MSKLINEKGKLFGLINIIDLFILITIIGAVAFVGAKFLNPSVSIISNQDDIELTFFSEQVYSFVADNLEINGLVVDDTKGVDLGRITDFKIEPGYLLTPTADGRQVKAPLEDYRSVEIHSLAKGQFVENGGIMINGNTYVIGHSFTIRAGKSKIFLKLAGFEKKS